MKSKKLLEFNQYEPGQKFFPHREFKPCCMKTCLLKISRGLWS